MILGITPARGGSKGISRKNIKPLCGRPLIAWTFEAARRSRLRDRYAVSTEDTKIAEVARRAGVEVIQRPPELADDETSTLQVLQHALAVVPAEVVVVLQATSPVRDDGLIDRCIEEFEAAQADSLATGFLCRHAAYGTSPLRRQDIGGTFCDDGYVYMIRGSLIRTGDRYGTHRREVVLDRAKNVDIDDEFDLWLAEQLLRSRSSSI